MAQRIDHPDRRRLPNPTPELRCAMPIYVYETTDGEKPKRRFEIKQSMKDAPLRVDPETGRPVTRVISGGFGFLEKGAGKSAPAPSGGHRCGPGGCGCH